MANKKRKTLQIKRPSANGPRPQKKPIPSDKKDSAGELDAKAEQADQAKKSATTRVPLPDEDKIRKARGAGSSEELDPKEKLPSAEQLDQAEKNATMPIEIDDGDVQSSSGPDLPGEDTGSNMDQTMAINLDEVESSSDIERELKEADSPKKDNDQTLQIDDDELEKSLASEPASENKPEAASEQEDIQSGETMKMDTMPMGEEVENELTREQLEETFSAQTMELDPSEVEKSMQEEASGEQEETDLTREELEESFSAQTMAMDPDQLAKELEESASKENGSEEKQDPNMTMDLSQQTKPKTIMVKRPSRDDTSPNAPTVKAARPDAATLKANRPVTANRGKAKETTSRVDLPAEETGGSKEGKTIKLKRPSGGPKPTSAGVSGVAGRAGIELDEDGSFTPMSKKEQPLGGAWLAVAILTFLISLAAIWAVVGISQPELPMPGRLVDIDGRLINR